MNYCKCHETLTLKEGMNALLDETKEFIVEPSRDEASDVVYCLNRMAGTLVGKPYVPLIPLDRMHREKIAVRMESYGCIRSQRHLIFGLCPSKFDKDKGYIKISFSVITGAHNLPKDSIYGVGLKMMGIQSGIYELDGTINILPANIG